MDDLAKLSDLSQGSQLAGSTAVVPVPTVPQTVENVNPVQPAVSVQPDANQLEKQRIDETLKGNQENKIDYGARDQL